MEEDLEKTEEKLLLANQKLDKAATAADDSERMKKVEDSSSSGDEMIILRMYLRMMRRLWGTEIARMRGR